MIKLNISIFEFTYITGQVIITINYNLLKMDAMLSGPPYGFYEYNY